MIYILVKRNNKQQLERILVKGHAKFDEYGRDIVCAAVSGITIGLTNAIEIMFGIKVHAEDDGDGKVDCHVPSSLNSEQTDQIRLIMEAMLISLKSVAEEFPGYIQINEKDV
jgi:uncharacterized protein